jgi:hypothetical protein
MEDEKGEPPARQPVDTGSDQAQQAGPPQIITPPDKTVARLEGHPLPGVLGMMAPAFRSSPFYLILCKWVEYTTVELQEKKDELVTIRAELVRVRADLEQKRIETGVQAEQIKALKKENNRKRFMQIIGGLLVGASYGLYQQLPWFLPTAILLLGLSLIVTAFIDPGEGER